MSEPTAAEFLGTLFGDAPGPRAQLVVWSNGADVAWCQSVERAATETARLAEGADVYFGVALQEPERALSLAQERARADGKTAPTDHRHVRGCTLSAAVLVAVHLDVDTQEGTHKGAEHLPPTLAEALDEIRAALPLEPSAVIHTGGGGHVWFLLDAPLVIATNADRERAARLVAGIQTTIRAAFERRGWSLDATHDLARVLRCPGTWNRKNGAPRSVHAIAWNPERRYSIDELELHAAELPEPRKPAPPPTSSSEVSAALQSRRDAWLSKAIKGACDKVRAAPAHQSHDTLRDAAHALGGLVHLAPWFAAAAETELLSAALNRRKPEDGADSETLIESGIRRSGRAEPRDPPDWWNEKVPDVKLRKKPRKVGGPAGPPPEGAIVIADGQLPRIVADVERVLAHSGHVYQRGDVLVFPSRVEREEKAKPGRPRRLRGTLHAPIASEHVLVEIAMRAAEFVRQDMRSTETGWKKTDLPAKYATHVLARKGHWPNTPELLGLAECPILRADGTVASASGYDAESGYLLGLSRDFPPVPERPTRAEAERALALLLEPIAEFPFTSEAARSVVLSGMLSPLARPAMRTVPGHAFDAPIMGTGKTLLADLPALLATGRCAAANQVPREEEELRKMLLALAIEGDPLLVLDNAEHALGSGALAAAMTAETIRGRLLGSTATATAPWTACVFVTGNNVALRGDVSTRFLRARINAGVENPEERDAFRIGDLRAWVLDHRAELVGAALTLLRWGVLLAERPKLRRFGRFEEYDRLVRAPLVALGCADPGDTRAELRAEDPVRERRRTLLRKLADAFPDGREFEFEDAARALAPDGVTVSQNHVRVSGVVEQKLRDSDLRDLKDKVLDGRRLVKAGEDRKGYARWRVEVLP